MADQPNSKLEIVWQGADEAVVFKPAGLSSERGAGDVGDCLLVRAQRALRWPECRLPHRLDRPTRGLMMISADPAAAARHGAEIQSHAWRKWYIARVPAHVAARGDAASLVGEHKAFLKRVGRVASVVRSGGDPSRLAVLATARATDDPSHAHLLIRLDTGRYHQIRVMMAYLGFPLIGDVDYGSRSAGALDLESAALLIARPGQLAAHRLRAHPARRGVSPAIEASLDEALARAAAQLSEA